MFTINNPKKNLLKDAEMMSAIKSQLGLSYADVENMNANEIEETLNKLKF